MIGRDIAHHPPQAPCVANCSGQQKTPFPLVPHRGISSQPAAAFQRCAAPFGVSNASQPRSRGVWRAVAAAEAAPAQSSAAAEKEETWHALVANAEFFFNDAQNEALAEQLREKRRFYREQGKELDFFIVSEPAWLGQRFPDEAAQVRRPCVALISTDKTWITFMKLRLDRVLKLQLTGMERSEVFSSGGPVPDFKPPEKWTAPYSPYAYGWWEAFFPENAAQ